MAKEEIEQGGQIPVESPINKDKYIHSNDSQMMYSTFFRFYDYEAQDGWVSRNKQLKDAGLDTSGIEIVNGKGVSNNGQYSQYNESEGEYMSYSEQLASLGIDESEYELTFGKGYAKSNGKETKPNYLTFTAVEDNASVFFHYWVGPGPGTIPDLGKNMEYSIDNGKHWNEYIISNVQSQAITLEHAGDSVMFRGINDTLYSTDPIGWVHCVTTGGKIAASGDITSLLNGKGGDIPIPYKCFHMFFFQDSSLVTSPNLPSTTLADNCYDSMFLLCSQLNSITVGLSSIPYDEDNARYPYTAAWLYSVAETGTFKWNGPVPYDGTRNDSSIPSGWTVENI